jgi:hypothetical protein
MHLMNPARRDRTITLIRTLAVQLGGAPHVRGIADQLVEQLSAIPVYRACDECIHFSKGHCDQWHADVPAAEQSNGCDAWDEDIPF